MKICERKIYMRTANDSTKFICATNDSMMHMKYATIDNLQPITIRKKTKYVHKLQLF